MNESEIYFSYVIRNNLFYMQIIFSYELLIDYATVHGF